MPRLAQDTVLRAQLGLDAIPDLVNACNAALDAATLQLESLLRTRFGVMVGEERFVVRSFEQRQMLRLTCGFLQASPAPTVTMGSRWDTPSEDRDDLTGQFVVDAERGTLTAFSPLSEGFYWVSYRSGFPVENGDDALYANDQVPAWLGTLVLTVARIHLASHPQVKETGQISDVASLASAAQAIIDQHSRYLPDALLPAYSRLIPV